MSATGQPATAGALQQALAERDQAGFNPVPVQVTGVADGYLAGQESALISALNGAPPVPTYVPLGKPNGARTAGRRWC